MSLPARQVSKQLHIHSMSLPASEKTGPPRSRLTLGERVTEQKAKKHVIGATTSAANENGLAGATDWAIALYLPCVDTKWM